MKIWANIQICLLRKIKCFELEKNIKKIKNVSIYQGNICVLASQKHFRDSQIFEMIHISFGLSPLESENMPPKFILQITEFPVFRIQWCKL